MYELSLFTGVGGGLLGSILLGWRTIGAVEIDDYCCRILEQRQKDGMLDAFPIWNLDIREFNRRVAPTYKGLVDVLTAGFPCQPFSVAGKRKGKHDDRNLWPETIDAIRIVEPRYVFLENVPGLLAHSYFGTILGQLAENGYDARWKVISAAEVGAPHKRDRVWIVAKSCRFNGEICLRERVSRSVKPEARRSRGNLESGLPQWPPLLRDVDGWNQIRESTSEPLFPGMANGNADRLDRLKSLGNAQVPEVVRVAWEILEDRGWNRI